MYQITLTVSQNIPVNHINEHSCQSMCSKRPPPARTHDLSVDVLVITWFASSVFAGRPCHESLFHTRIAI